MAIYISGIQQIGIGIPHVHNAFRWYRQNFNMDVPVFDEAATAALMLPYTGGQPHDRHAILAINLQGGGGFEIWQYVSRTPQPAKFELQLGDLGIFSTKIKCHNVRAVYDHFLKKDLNVVGLIAETPEKKESFFLTDPYGNLFQIVEGDQWFKKGKDLTGGAYGCTIGVTDMERSKKFYKEILGYDQVVYEVEDKFEDLKLLPGGDYYFQRVLLRHSKERQGGFSRMLGKSEIELVKVKGKTPRRIFDNRFWGDLGFIHLCFDIFGMEELEEKCRALGHPFTVDSANSFDMGQAAGRFAYIEDPDGTLIEFVETHKLPILKKIGWYKNMRKRNPANPLPDWMLKSMRFNRVKD